MNKKYIVRRIQFDLIKNDRRVKSYIITYPFTFIENIYKSITQAIKYFSF